MDKKQDKLKGKGPELQSLRAIRADDLAKVRAALCLYDPERDVAANTLASIKKMPGITADDLAKVRAALCLYDPER